MMRRRSALGIIILIHTRLAAALVCRCARVWRINFRAVLGVGRASVIGAVVPQLFSKFRAFSPLRATAAPEQKGIELVVSAAMSASPAAASRLFVVRDDSVETKNEADVYVHGSPGHPTISGFPKHITI